LAVAALPTNKPQSLQRRGTTTATLIIPSRTGHRRVLQDYFVKAGSANYSDISIGNVTWNRIWDNLVQAILIGDLNSKLGDLGFLRWLGSWIPDFPYPSAADDEDITIARAAAPTRIDAYFRDVTEGDVVGHAVPGGSMASRQFLMVNLNNASAVSATGFFNFDKLDMPVGLNPFTEGTDIVAAGRRMSSAQRFTVYAIAGDFPKAIASKATRVHITDEMIELFTSENSEGLFVDIDAANELAFSLSCLLVFRLPEPYVFEPNRLYTFRGEATYDAANALPAGSLKLFLLGIREYLGAV